MIFITVFYFFFTVGLNKFSKILFKEISFNRDNLILYPIPISPVLTLITLLIFCVFTNFLLLLPYFGHSLNLPLEYVLKLSSFLKIFLKTITYFFCILGIYDFLNLAKTYKTFEFRSKKFCIGLYISLILSFLIYYFLAPKLPELILFDTGYYHYPLVKHLSAFGIEKGIGNLYPGYAIYNLNLFGQVPFHNLFATSEYLSPSINIIFLSLYIWFFIEEFILFRKNDKKIYFLNIPYQYIVLLYFGISSIFCSSSFVSYIASYSPNLAIFVAGSLSFYIIFSSSFLGERYFSKVLIFLISIFSPLLKISATTVGILNFTLFCIYIVKKDYLNKFKNLNLKNKLFYCFKLFKKIKLLKYCILILIFSYFIASLTNIIWSGYILFPSNFLGPIGDYAMNKNDVIGLKEVALSWHRYGGEIPINGASKNIFIWFPYFITSRNGLIIIIYWILPNIISLIINNFKILEKKIYISKDEISLNNLVLVISLFTLLNVIFLITAPSYTPWLTPVIIFLSVISLCSISIKNSLILKFQKFAIFSSFTVLIIGSLKFSYSNQVIINNLFQNTYLTKFPNLEFRIMKYKPKKWSPSILNKDLTVDINVSNTEQCWNIPSPCLTNGNYNNLKN